MLPFPGVVTRISDLDDVVLVDVDKIAAVFVVNFVVVVAFVFAVDDVVFDDVGKCVVTVLAVVFAVDFLVVAAVVFAVDAVCDVFSVNSVGSSVFVIVVTTAVTVTSGFEDTAAVVDDTENVPDDRAVVAVRTGGSSVVVTMAVVDVSVVSMIILSVPTFFRRSCSGFITPSRHTKSTASAIAGANLGRASFLHDFFRLMNLSPYDARNSFFRSGSGISKAFLSFSRSRFFIKLLLSHNVLQVIENTFYPSVHGESRYII